MTERLNSPTSLLPPEDNNKDYESSMEQQQQRQLEEDGEGGDLLCRRVNGEDGDNTMANRERGGVKFLTIWASTALLIIIIWFVLLFRFPSYDPSDNNANKYRMRDEEGSGNSGASHNLNAYIIHVDNECSLDAWHAWQDLLQQWARRPPCLAQSQPLNWEHTTVHLIVEILASSPPANMSSSSKDSNLNDCNTLIQGMQATWEWLSEKPKLCFIDMSIRFFEQGKEVSDSGDDVPHSLTNVFVADLWTRPLKTNWLNHLAILAKKHSMSKQQAKKSTILTTRRVTGNAQMEWRALYLNGSRGNVGGLLFNSKNESSFDGQNVINYAFFGPMGDPDALFYDARPKSSTITSASAKTQADNVNPTVSSAKVADFPIIIPITIPNSNAPTTKV